MENEPKGLWGCVVGIFEMIGFFLALSWPILLLFQWATNHTP